MITDPIAKKVKEKLIEGLIDTGCNIEDIGLALSPTVYFAQFNLNADASCNGYS